MRRHLEPGAAGLAGAAPGLAELWRTTVELAPTSKRSLVYHAWVTLSATLLGFVMGTVLGVLLAVAIVHVRSLDKSLMPWVIAARPCRSSPSRR